MSLTIKKLFKTTVLPLALAMPMAYSNLTFATESANTSQMRLQTSLQEVNGVRDIEAGNYQHGIRKTQAALTKTSVASQRAPLLVNLCVAHIALNELEQARQYCDEAVIAGTSNPIAFNNRAVLNCLTQQVNQCIDDLEQAKILTKQNRMINQNLHHAKQSLIVSR